MAPDTDSFYITLDAPRRVQVELSFVLAPRLGHDGQFVGPRHLCQLRCHFLGGTDVGLKEGPWAFYGRTKAAMCKPVNLELETVNGVLP